MPPSCDLCHLITDNTLFCFPFRVMVSLFFFTLLISLFVWLFLYQFQSHLNSVCPLLSSPLSIIVLWRSHIYIPINGKRKEKITYPLLPLIALQ